MIEYEFTIEEAEEIFDYLNETSYPKPDSVLDFMNSLREDLGLPDELEFEDEED